MRQTIPVAKEARINLASIHGDLEIQGWDKPEISLEWDEHDGQLSQEGNSLTLVQCNSDLEIRAPYDVEVRADGLDGDISAQDIRRIELKNIRGKVELQN